MRSGVPTAYSNALADAHTNGLIIRTLVTFFVLNEAGETVVFPFWDDYGVLDIDVLDGDTGEQVTRTFVGNEAIVEVGPTPNVNDLSIQRISIRMNPLHTQVADMVRGHNIRLARTEIHRLLLDPQTRNSVAAPPCDFTGQLNLSPVTTPSVGGTADVTIDIVSDNTELTRLNSAKKDDAASQRRHSGDNFRQYAAQLAVGVQLAWGEKTIG